MDAVLTELTGFIDDIIVAAASQDELFQCLFSVFSRIQQYWFRVKAEKGGFFLEQIKCLGFIFSKHGRQPDQENILAVKKDMLKPTNETTLGLFFDLVSHLQNFISNLL